MFVLVYNVLGIPFVVGVLYLFMGWLLLLMIVVVVMLFSLVDGACVVLIAFVDVIKDSIFVVFVVLWVMGLCAVMVLGDSLVAVNVVVREFGIVEVYVVVKFVGKLVFVELL